MTALRELHERQELEKAKQALEEKDRQKDHFIAQEQQARLSQAGLTLKTDTDDAACSTNSDRVRLRRVIDNFSPTPSSSLRLEALFIYPP